MKRFSIAYKTEIAYRQYGYYFTHFDTGISIDKAIEYLNDTFPGGISVICIFPTVDGVDIYTIKKCEFKDIKNIC